MKKLVNINIYQLPSNFFLENVKYVNLSWRNLRAFEKSENGLVLSSCQGCFSGSHACITPMKSHEPRAHVQVCLASGRGVSCLSTGSLAWGTAPTRSMSCLSHWLLPFTTPFWTAACLRLGTTKCLQPTTVAMHGSNHWVLSSLVYPHLRHPTVAAQSLFP